MAAELLLINPRRRKRRRKGRMPPGLARYWAGKRRKLRAPKRRRRRARASALPVVRRRRRRVARLGAPRVRRRKLRNPRRRARRHVSRIRRRRIHRNPRFGLPSMGGIKGFTRGTLMPAAIGAGGALALDVAYGYAAPYLPTFFSNRWATLGVKILGAIGIGMVAGKVLGRERGRVATLGAITVVGYGALKSAAQQAFPTVPGLSGYADFVDQPMGAYMRPQTMGFLSPAAVIQPQTMGAYMAPQNLNGIDGYNWQNDGM